MAEDATSGLKQLIAAAAFSGRGYRLHPNRYGLFPKQYSVLMVRR